MVYSLEGKWEADIGDGQLYPIYLPGTLDENKIGRRDNGNNQWHPDSSLGNRDEEFQKDGLIRTRYTRKYTFEGAVKLKRRVIFAAPTGKRIFLEVERARCLGLLIDDKEIPDFKRPSISTPHVFEVTDYWEKEHEITLISDNSYPGLPHDDIVYSSAATDETQTNWNGVLGYLRLRVEDTVFFENIRVYPMGNTLTVKISLCTDRLWKGKVTVKSNALMNSASIEACVQKGITEISLENLPLAKNVVKWDEFEGHLYELTADLSGGESKTVTFGIRDFGTDKKGKLALNGRTIFLRSESNCGVFPETGYCPMQMGEWVKILEIYKSYGINCVRFHSHCPPEAAFMAADRVGMLMQPELSHWNPRDAFESEESFIYYQIELVEVIQMLANHPSFVMLTLGNELHATSKGHARMRELLDLARGKDVTRLYANGSNVHYGAYGCDEYSDFYTSSKYLEQDLRGTFANMEGYINEKYPNAMTNFDDTMKSLREIYVKPVFSFEVGQFEVLPDFKELEDFQGISDPVSLCQIKKGVEEKGLMPVWEKYVEATGELARIGYREEIEAAMRTKHLSGISLLGLQDFPGQGTALVGMLNSHMKQKPYRFASPEAFRAFFASQLPLVLLPKYTYENTESLEARVWVANYGKEDMEGELCCRLKGPDFDMETKADPLLFPVGELTDAGTLKMPLCTVGRPMRLELTVWVGEVSNRYPIWVYPPVNPVCPESIYETEHLDDKAKAALEDGKTVYLTPPSTKEALPASIKAQFTTDFWSVGTFAGQEGGMGQLIDAQHPLFKDFPTEFHSNWQWWIMASQRAIILPKQYKSIITEMDSYAYLRSMTKLLECRCKKGKLLLSSMGLQNLQKYTEARALLSSIYRYMDSAEFAPEQEIEWEVLEALVR